MGDHTEPLRIEAEGMRLHGYGDTADAIEALLDERDALAARLDRLEHAARVVCSYDGPEADAHVAAAICRDALGDNTWPPPLPPIGATVHNRGGGTGIVERRAAFLRRPDGTLSPPAAFVRWPGGGGAWFTANELEAANG